MDMKAAPAAYADATMKTDATEGSKLSSERELQLELMVRERDEHLVILSVSFQFIRRPVASPLERLFSSLLFETTESDPFTPATHAAEHR